MHSILIFFPYKSHIKHFTAHCTVYGILCVHVCYDICSDSTVLFIFSHVSTTAYCNRKKNKQFSLIYPMGYATAKIKVTTPTKIRIYMFSTKAHSCFSFKLDDNNSKNVETNRITAWNILLHIMVVQIYAEQHRNRQKAYDAISNKYTKTQ